MALPEGTLGHAYAEFLPAQDWEALLELPLSPVRAQLRVEPAPTYEQRRSSGAPPVAAPA